MENNEEKVTKSTCEAYERLARSFFSADVISTFSPHNSKEILPANTSITALTVTRNDRP